MFTTKTWHICTDHRVPYPPGAVCPRCQRELKERKEAALAIHWKDVIPLDQQLDFVDREHVYCRDEEHAWFSYKGDNANELEKLRIAVLEKRAEFLKLFMKITITTNEELLNVHKPEDSN